MKPEGPKATTDPKRLQPTSERVTADGSDRREGDYLIYLCHVATYDFALAFVNERRVLDFGCGTGYGAHRIAPRCASVTGVDVSAEAVAFARERYVADNLTFRQVAPVEDEPLPFPDKSFDVVLSFQVIEHVADADRYLAEIRRVLAESGVVIVATPDRTSRLLPGQRPWNRYHVREYSSDELEGVLRPHFAAVELNSLSGDLVIIGPELKRSRRLKWATLLFTFPGSPEPWRQMGLRGLAQLQTRLIRGREPAGSRSYSYDETALRIAPGAVPSVGIVAVARPNPGGGPAGA